MRTTATRSASTSPTRPGTAACLRRRTADQAVLGALCAGFLLHLWVADIAPHAPPNALLGAAKRLSCFFASRTKCECQDQERVIGTSHMSQMQSLRYHIDVSWLECKSES